MWHEIIDQKIKKRIENREGMAHKVRKEVETKAQQKLKVQKT